MITVTFDGVEFTKASEVAKQFGYTSDYLGQLCRSKKVNARLVGRTWFVNVPSLEAHREKRYQTTKSKVAVKEAGSKTSDTIEKTTEADLSNKTYLKRVQSPKSRVRKIEAVADSSVLQDRVALQYEADDFSLIPRVDSKPKVTLLKVGIAESESLKVKSDTKKGSYLKPQPLPEVALSGKLKVQQIALEEVEENISDTRDNHKNKDDIDKLKAAKDSEEAKKQVRVTKVSKIKSQPSLSTVKPKKVQDSSEMTTLKPDTHNEISVSKVETTVISESGGISVAFQLSTFTAAVISGLLILTLEQVGYGAPNAIEFSLGFSWSNLASLGAFLYTGT